MVPTDLVTNSFLSSFCILVQIKNKDQVSANWWSGNKKYLFFVYEDVFINKFSYVLLLFVL